MDEVMPFFVPMTSSPEAVEVFTPPELESSWVPLSFSWTESLKTFFDPGVFLPFHRFFFTHSLNE